MKRRSLSLPAALLLAAFLLLSGGCSAGRALPPAAISTAAPTPAPTPEPTPAPTPAPPAAMAADGEHPQLIAHAGGAVWGYRYTNSLEALETAWAAGFRFLELDFQWSADGEIVLIHDWEAMARRLLGREGPLSRAEFLSRGTLAGFTLLDLDGLLAWLAEHPGCSVVTDVKSEENEAMLRALRTRAGDLADRFIPQAYSLREAGDLREAGWERVILTLYRMEALPAELEEFLEETPLWAVTVSEGRLTEALAAAVSETGTALYCHPVNSLDFFDEWREKGLTGIYTDYFQPAHWPY